MTVTCLIVKTNCTIVMLNLILKCSNSETQQSKIHYSQNSFPHSLFHKCTPLQCNNRRASLAWNFYLENLTDSYVFDWLYFSQCLTSFSSINHLPDLDAWFLIYFIENRWGPLDQPIHYSSYNNSWYVVNDHWNSVFDHQKALLNGHHDHQYLNVATTSELF